MVKKRVEWIVILLGSLMYALMYSFGSLIFERDTCEPVSVLVRTACALPVFMIALRVLFRMHGQKKNANSMSAEESSFSTAAGFMVILGSFLLFFLLVYPGTYAYDAPAQIYQIKKSDYSAHHPLIHTFLLRCCIALLPVLGSLQSCAVLYMIIQITAMAAMYALVCASIGRMAGKRTAWTACAFFALYPLHMCFSSQMTKDSLFAAFFALLFTLMTELVVCRNYNWKLMAGIVFSGALSIAFRNNMFHAAAALTFLLLFLLKKPCVRRLAICMAAAILLGTGIQSVLKTALDAKETDPREMLAWPCQQMARARLYAGDRFSDEEKALFEALISEREYSQYEAFCADHIKGRIDGDLLKERLGEYIDLYISIGKKCTQEYVDAIAALIYPYIYPYPEYRVGRAYVEMGIKSEGFDQYYGEGQIRTNPAFEGIRQWMNRNIWDTGANRIPVVRWIFNLGVISWVMLYLVMKQAYDGNWTRFIVSLLPVLLWGTHLLGPIMNGRYVYAFVCILPALWSGEKQKG